MSHWNHRVVRQILDDESAWYSIREVFYNDDDSIMAYTEDPVDISGESIDDIRKYLQWCLNCLDKPILEDGKVEFKNDDEPLEHEGKIFDTIEEMLDYLNGQDEEKQ